MDGHRQNVVDIDVGRPQGRPPFASSQSPTFRLHFHNFETSAYRMDSPEFLCFGCRWTAGICPEGRSNAREGMVSFGLTKCFDSDDESTVDSSDSESSGSNNIKVRFTASVKDLDGRVVKQREKTHEFEYYNDDKWFLHLIERNAVIGASNNVLVDGTLTIELQMEAIGVKNAPCQPFYPGNPLMKNINNLFLDENTADVLFTVSSDGETANFHAHRLVLKACAKDLASFCDASDDLTPIALPRVDPRVFRLVLFYIYGGQISTADWKRHSRELIDAADLYGVVNLKLEAEAKYAAYTTVDIENVVDLLVYANSKQCAHLKEMLMDFVVRNKNDVLKRVTSVPESSTMFTDLLSAMVREEGKSEDHDGAHDTMRVGTLRRKLHERGLDVDGSREALIARLKESSKAPKKAGEKRKRDAIEID